MSETLGEESLAVEEQATEEVSEAVEDAELEAGEDTVEEAESESEDKPKKKGGFQRRIERLEREKFEAELRAERLQEALQQRRIPEQQEQQGQIPMPRLEDFDYDTDRFNAAVNQWHQVQVQQMQDKQREAQEQMARQQAEYQRAMAFQQKVTSATEKYPDFMMKVNNPELPSLQMINPVAFEAVLDSDQFSDVAYFLASNPAELYAFRGLNQAQTIRKVAKLELELTGKTATKPPPAPPGKLQGKSPVNKRVEDMTMEEYVEYRRQQRG